MHTTSLSQGACLASPSESSPSASSKGSCPAPADKHSWPLHDSSTDAVSQPLAHCFHTLTMSPPLLSNVPIRHCARGTHARARVSKPIDYWWWSTRHCGCDVHLQTLCISGSRRTASHRLPRSHRSLHPQYYLHHIDTRTQKAEVGHRVQETQSSARWPLFTFHVCQVKPRDVATRDQRLVDSQDRALRVPLVCTI